MKSIDDATVNNPRCSSGGSCLNIIWRTINALMSLFFLCAASVQFNDPDPYLWVPIYMLPFFLTMCIVVAPCLTDLFVWRCLCVATICMAMSLAVFQCWLLVDKRGTYTNPLALEEGRELGGAVIVTVWLLLCIVRTGLHGGQFQQFSLMGIILVVSLTPILLWILCLFSSADLPGHCNDMFPDILGQEPPFPHVKN